MEQTWLAHYVERFHPSCPLCKSTLQATLSCCPHCHAELRLGLAVRETYLASWGIALGAAAVTASFGLFLLFLSIRSGVAFGTLVITIIDSILGLLMAIALIILLCCRRWFCRQKRLLQWLVAGAFWIIALASVGILALTLARL